MVELPTMVRREFGVLVPIPTLPLFKTVKRSVFVLPVVDPIAKSLVFVSPAFACTESFANGEVVPTPKFPALVSRAPSVIVEPLRLKNASAEVVETPLLAVKMEAIREVEA